MAKCKFVLDVKFSKRKAYFYGTWFILASIPGMLRGHEKPTREQLADYVFDKSITTSKPRAVNVSH